MAIFIRERRILQGFTCSLGVFPVSIKNEDFLSIVRNPETKILAQDIRKNVRSPYLFLFRNNWMVNTASSKLSKRLFSSCGVSHIFVQMKSISSTQVYVILFSPQSQLHPGEYLELLCFS